MTYHQACWEKPLLVDDPRARAAADKLLHVSVIPIQMDRRRAWTGEEELLLAVFEQAVEDLRRTGTREPHKTWRRDARKWVCGAEGRYTFDRVCEIFGWDIETLRAKLLALGEVGRKEKLNGC